MIWAGVRCTPTPVARQTAALPLHTSTASREKACDSRMRTPATQCARPAALHSIQATTAARFQNIACASPSNAKLESARKSYCCLRCSSGAATRQQPSGRWPHSRRRGGRALITLLGRLIRLRATTCIQLALIRPTLAIMTMVPTARSAFLSTTRHWTARRAWPTPNCSTTLRTSFMTTRWLGCVGSSTAANPSSCT